MAWLGAFFGGAPDGCPRPVSPGDVAVAAANEAAIARTPLVELLQSLHRLPHRTACDAALAAEQLRVAARLTAEQQQQRPPPFLSRGGECPLSSLGPIHLIETGFGSGAVPVPPGTPAAHRIARGWADVFRQVDDLDASPHGAEERAEMVESALSMAYGLTMEDAQRLAGRSMGIDDNTLVVLRTTRREIERCIADPSCLEPHLSADSVALCSHDNPLYAHFLEDIARSRFVDTKRRLLREWAAQINRDISFSAFVPNEDIFLQGGDLVVPVIAGDFTAVRQELAQIIESVWQDAPHHRTVRVRWTTAEQHPAAYRFVVGSSMDGRDHVDPLRREIALHAYTTQRAIAHEFGHVLGLPDHYSTRWDEDACSYELRFDFFDIMSNHMTGAVTEHEWRDLWAAYGAS